ncbi:hypothetical protein [Sphingomonas oligophenolica]|uniref:Uncharacterized protein n=1 Tax=Sphingomonas oligophenolica TaxID=301154 RepID=A0A502CHB0_9SPHN|nr:hypothetical protein [Sphingomonas oligophenolica]TPG11984.1 hypothetical protein EAH84_10885 [Sphingomonas oligophenolica]
MTHIYVFNIALFAACGYAFWCGGSPERLTAAVFLIAAAASYARPDGALDRVQLSLLAIDVATLAGLVVIALMSNRFWPLYVSALQLLTLAIHGVKAYEPDLPYWMYVSANGKLAYPTLILLTIGVLRHRERVARSGVDRAWSSAISRNCLPEHRGLTLKL